MNIWEDIIYSYTLVLSTKDKDMWLLGITAMVAEKTTRHCSRAVVSCTQCLPTVHEIGLKTNSFLVFKSTEIILNLSSITSSAFILKAIRYLKSMGVKIGFDFFQDH